jgi:hypothetical protein
LHSFLDGVEVNYFYLKYQLKNISLLTKRRPALEAWEGYRRLKTDQDRYDAKSLKDFGGNSSQTRGVLNVELTIALKPFLQLSLLLTKSNVKCSN